MDLQGKLSLVTGGSSGIGLALAKKLAAQGSHVWILARNPAKLEEACQEISDARQSTDQKINAVSADVSQFESISAAVDGIVKQAGTPDFLFNSAGIAEPGYVTQLDLDIYRKTMDINFFGTLYATRAVLPGMVQRGSGYIINISSIAGFLGLYGYSAYGPSKFAVRGLSDSMRYELAEHGIRVSVVFPPDTQTPQLDYENRIKPPIVVELDKANKVMTADAVADNILKGVAQKRYIITPGTDSSLYFKLTNFFGLVYPVMDLMVAQARRTLNGSNGNGAAKNNGRH